MTEDERARLTPRERVLAAERQISMVATGQHDEIECPFCGDVTVKGQMLCCANMADMVLAFANRAQAGEQMEVIERVMERVQKMGQSMVVVS